MIVQRVMQRCSTKEEDGANHLAPSTSSGVIAVNYVTEINKCF